MICPQCHTENKPDDKFCEQCGTPLTAQGPEGDGLGATVMAGPAAPSVLVRQGADAGEVFPLGPRAVIGRLDTCDLPVDDRSVSREHARLSRLRDGYVIEDLGSTNGTLVNGQRIHEAVLLHPGDLVSVGSVEFRFDSAGQEGAAVQAEQAPAAEPAPPEPIVPPTMQELPPMPVDFPPLEPFAVGPEAEPEPQPEPVAESPFAPSSWAPQQEAPPAPVAETPPPPAVDTPPEAPQEPSSSDRVPVSAPDVSGDVLQEAAAAANRLTALVEQLVSQLNDAKAQRDRLESERTGLQEAQTRMQEHIDSLENGNRAQESARRALQQVPAETVPPDQMQQAREALDALAQNPRDVEVLMKFGQHARNLSAIVEEYSRLRQTLDQVAEALGAGQSR